MRHWLREPSNADPDGDSPLIKMLTQQVVQIADQVGAMVVTGAGMAIVAVSMTAQYITLAVGVLNGIALIAGGIIWLVHIGAKTGRTRAQGDHLAEAVNRLSLKIDSDRQERRERDQTIYRRLESLNERVSNAEGRLSPPPAQTNPHPNPRSEQS